MPVTIFGDATAENRHRPRGVIFAAGRDPDSTPETGQRAADAGFDIIINNIRYAFCMTKADHIGLLAVAVPTPFGRRH
jgi:hypothetical protein